MRYAMIMAGGSGTRLWPMSRQGRPKQLIPLINGKSLLQVAAERIADLVPFEHQLICTGEAFRGQIREAMPRFSEAQIIGEPQGRDTVNAIGLTAAVLERQDPDAIFAVLTADHLISPEDRFRETIDQGFRLIEASSQRLVTFSIDPTYPATGYGYVERAEPIDGFPGAFRVARFVEKPVQATAQRYIESGRFGWNSGMFVFSARGFLRALKQFRPECHVGLVSIADAWDTPERAHVLNAVYPALPKISVDFAVMEPTSTNPAYEVCTVRMPIDWIDVGSWPSFAETLSPDASENRTNAGFVHLDSHNVLAVSDNPGHTIATIGCRDLMVIHARDITLVCPVAQAQRVKDLAHAAPRELQ